jgi:hypothetical protein
MARTSEGSFLTERHRAGQVQIRAATLRDFIRIWPLWDGEEDSFRRLIAASLPLVRSYHQLSSSFAAAYYEAFRKAEKVGGNPTPRLADPIDEDKVAAGLIVTGQAMTRKAILAGQSPQAARQTALIRTGGSVTRQALSGGRATLLQSASADRQAQGWVRVTSGDPCAFCALLASNGPTYSESGSDFQAHDHCSCTAEPAYEGSEWPGRAGEFRSLYDQHAKGTTDPLNSFRRVLEGRA